MRNPRGCEGLLTEPLRLLRNGRGGQASEVQIILVEDEVPYFRRYPVTCCGESSLLSDVIMPGGVSGCSLAKQLLTKDPNLMVILMSGYSASGLEPYGVLNSEII